MAFDKSGKYHMSPHHAKMTDKANESKPPKKGPEGSPKEEASEPPQETSAEGDQGAGMSMDDGMNADGGEVSCPACGAHFPLELGLGQPQHPVMAGHGAVPTHESQGAHMPVLGGY